MKKIILPFVLMFTASTVFAGGYRVSLQGQKAQGMGHASVGLAESTETIFFNPAGLALVEDKSVTAGVTFVDAKSRYQNISLGESAETDSPISTPINFYWGKDYGDDAAIGLGIYTPFGSTVEWPQDWAGSHLVNDIALQAVFIQPTYSRQVSDKFSFGVGPILAVGAIELNRNLSTSLADANGDRSNVTLKDSGITDFGLNLGAMFKVSDDLNIGLTYRTEMMMESEGKADFDNIPGAFQPVFQDGGYTADLPLPAEFTVGLSYQANDKLTLVADYNYTFWDTYEDLTINFDSVADPSRATSTNPRNYKNAATYRFGAQYKKSDRLTFRGGIYFDETPIRDGYFAPETPRGDQIGLTGGVTYTVRENFDLDFSAIVLDFDQEDNSYDFSSEGPFEGSYTNSVFILGAGATFKF